MQSSKFKVQSSKAVIGGRSRKTLVSNYRSVAASLRHRIAVFLLLTAYSLLPTVKLEHEGEDHSAGKKTVTTAAATGIKITSVTAERNVQADAGQFNVQLTRTPSDPRTGETAQFVVRLGEKVEGGFGNGEPAPLENALVTANITTATGGGAAENLAAAHEGGSAYRLAYAFRDAGVYKIVFNVNAGDGRAGRVRNCVRLRDEYDARQRRRQ